jgi:putative endonuclease
MVSDASSPVERAGGLSACDPASLPGGWCVYMLRCADGTLYTGCAASLSQRLKAHARGSAKYTRSRLPVVLVYAEAALDRSAALRREAALKRLSRTQKLALCGMT